MALWGNNDNVGYKGAGTVSLDYDTKTVTGTGTSFGVTGFAQEGDVIRFGFRGTGGTYFGDAAIVGIASTTQLSIASTDGLSGAAIAATSFWISELPQYTTLNPLYSEDSTFNKESSSWQNIFTGVSLDYVGTGASVIGIDGTFNNEYYTLVDPRIGAGFQGDKGIKLLNNSTQIAIQDIGKAYVSARFTTGIGTDILPVGREDLPGLTTTTADTPVPSSYQNGGDFYAIVSVAATTIGLGQTVDHAITAGDKLLINNDNITWLSANVGAGIATGDNLVFQNYRGGHDRYVYGVSGAAVDSALNTTYETGAGWVGVTTYMDNHGNLRVKKEILVAMAGITTGPAGAAGTAGDAYPPG